MGTDRKSVLQNMLYINSIFLRKNTAEKLPLILTITRLLNLIYYISRYLKTVGFRKETIDFF